jgi:hypothetical protein
MKNPIRLTGITLLLAVSSLSAATHYVSLESTNPTPPYTNWATAATNIQDAVDAAAASDEVVVTNGVYAGGLAATNLLALRSVNGPQLTIINGGGTNRCANLSDGASLSGFTLTNGACFSPFSGGGGVWCASTNAVVSNCVIVGNSATGQGGAGGGIWQGTLYDCRLSGNRASGLLEGGHTGGGAAFSTLYNCTLTDNSAWIGGGALSSTLYNCTLTGNSARKGGGALSSTLYNCTLTGNSASFGGGACGGTLNNCIVYFNTAGSGGANYDSACTLNYCCTTPLPANGVGNITNEPAFVNGAAGNYRLSPGSPCIDAGTNLSAMLTNDLDGRLRPVDGDGDGLAAFDIGAYEYRELLVWADSASPVPPYATWATAATNIQDAVDAAITGDEIVVTNAVYPGGVAVIKPLALRSVNGPQLTIIDGGGTNRCVSLTDGASLTGFTLTNGIDSTRGGGIWCASTNAVVSNCVIVGNIVEGWGSCEGGGVCRGTLFNCTLSGNSAVVYDPAWAQAAGGGAYGSTLYNCTLTGNFARVLGGGADSSTLYNCTLTGNWAVGGGGAHNSTLNNCIVYFNTASSDLNCDFSSTLNYCCTTPMPTNGVGNITNAPLLVDYAGGSLRLQSNSPCINAGNNDYVTWSTDLDGNPRIVSGTVDIGAYEYQGPGSLISYAWLQQYGLPTDGAADFGHADADGMNNWQEWCCGTCPTNAVSALRLLSASPTGTNVAVTWQSVVGVSYFLERSADLASAFTLLATNILGQAASTTYADTNAAGAGPFFYRVGVSCP